MQPYKKKTTCGIFFFDWFFMQTVTKITLAILMMAQSLNHRNITTEHNLRYAIMISISGWGCFSSAADDSQTDCIVYSFQIYGFSRVLSIDLGIFFMPQHIYPKWKTIYWKTTVNNSYLALPTWYLFSPQQQQHQYPHILFFSLCVPFGCCCYWCFEKCETSTNFYSLAHGSVLTSTCNTLENMLFTLKSSKHLLYTLLNRHKYSYL